MTDIVERLENSGPTPSIFAVREAAAEINEIIANINAANQ
jgi:hypothetical protein